MDVIGLGEAGCNIAECFRKYPQYNIYKIDAGVSGENCFNIPTQKDAEAYEKNIPDLKEFFSNLSNEVIFIFAGSGAISGMSLAMLQQIKNKKVTVLYIRPGLRSLTGKKKLLERATFGILQQYARSGLLDGMHVVSNDVVAGVIGNLPVIGYFNKINDIIASTLHFINVFDRTKHVYGVVEDRDPVCRISTIGLLDSETSEEKMFYDFDLIREKSYFYAFTQSRLLNESNLIEDIESQIEKKKETWLTKISYRLYSTEYEADFGYCLYRTSKVQGEA